MPHKYKKNEIVFSESRDSNVKILSLIVYTEEPSFNYYKFLHQGFYYTLPEEDLRQAMDANDIMKEIL